MDVADWLRCLGLEVHESAFAENGIDGSLLADLTNEDLKDLGVAKLADRKRLLNAIADLPTNTAPKDRTLSLPPTAAGEHRQVSVLFADISGFTKLTAELGAENIHALLNRFFETVDAIVASHGGTVDKHIGDNVMAVFGAPIAHDDDPLRAVRAASEIHRQVGELQDGHGRKLGVHVGIASGQVVASGTGSDRHREYTVTGASVNLAARLQSMAGVGETLISEALHRAVAHAVACDRMGESEIKGIERPVVIWKVKAQHNPDKRLATRMAFIGREAELAQLSRIVERCRESGRGSAVVLRGEAGIGKTRLVEELTSLAAAHGFRTHRGLVLDFGAGEGRDAIRAIVQSLLDISAGSDQATRQAAANLAVNGGLVAAERRIFLNDLLDLAQSSQERSVYDAMTNATRNEGKRTVLAELLRALAAKQALIVIVEDVHWADTLVLAHLARIATTFADCPGLLAMTSRVDGYPLSQAWRSSIGDCPFMTIDVAPLRKEESLRLAAFFIDTAHQTAQECILRSGGNPLFLEQLLRNVEENDDGDVPASIQSLVLARLDRLPFIDKQALQAASVLGQRFGLDAVRHLIGFPGYDCRVLIERSFIRPEGDNFLFGHALVQEGVFGSLLKQQREKLHRLAAAFFDKTDAILHAQHLDRANDAAAPTAYLDAAVAQAAALHFNTVIALAGRGLEIVEDPAVKCSLACLRGEALRNTGATEESIVVFEAGLAAAIDPRQRCLALIGIAEGLRITDQQQRTLEVLKVAEAAARDADLLPELARIHSLRGNVYFPLGRLNECREEHEKALDLSRRVGLVEGEALALSGLGDAYYLTGKMLSAGQQFRACVELCQQHGLRRVEVANRHMIGWTRLHLLEFVEAEADGLAAVKLAVEVGHPRAQLLGLELAGYVNAEMGKIEESNQLLKQGHDLAQSLHADNFAAQSLHWLARNALTDGDRLRAKTYAAQAVQIVRKVGMTFIGPAVLAIEAVLTDDEALSQAILKEAEDILDTACVAHNHFWFAQTAITHALQNGTWDRAERYAARLEVYTQSEPLPWSDFLIAKGRALAAWGRGERSTVCVRELRRLKSIAMDKHLIRDLDELNTALVAV